jgi:transcriptional regulator with XRE-family HTH domain
MTDRKIIRARSRENTRAVLDFKAALVQQRKDHHLSQQEVAERMGASQPTVSQFETYDSNPTMRTVQKYANAVDALIQMHVRDDCARTDQHTSWSKVSDEDRSGNNTRMPIQVTKTGGRWLAQDQLVVVGR